MTFASQDGTTPVLDPTVDWEVEIGSSSYELVTSSDGIYLADPQAYEGVVDAGETVAATARPSTSVTALAVPVSALITDAAGLYCVWGPRRPGILSGRRRGGLDRLRMSRYRGPVSSRARRSSRIRWRSWSRSHVGRADVGVAPLRP